MKKYNVFNLYVVEKDNHNFICEKLIDYEYKEILTKEKFVLQKNDKVKPLTKYYSILEVATYRVGKILDPLMLTKKDILIKYIEINEKVVDKKTGDFIKNQQEELEGLKILAKECPELAKKEAIEKLQSTGILDENGDVKSPYQKVFAQITDNQKTKIK